MMAVVVARALSAELLGAESCRWRHSAAVAEQAAKLSATLPPQHGQLLVAAAWLHDIGYAEPLNRSGFHPLDGARYLRAEGHEELACLTAHHSSADVEARHRGLSGELAEFATPPSRLLHPLTFSDMTSGPTGRRLTFDERLLEILERYGRDHLVARAIGEAEVDLRAAVEQFAHLV